MPRLHVSINVTDERGRTVSFGLSVAELEAFKRFAAEHEEGGHVIGDHPFMIAAGIDLLCRLRKLVDEWPT